MRRTETKALLRDAGAGDFAAGVRSDPLDQPATLWVG